jgi:hypothetical protein
MWYIISQGLMHFSDIHTTWVKRFVFVCISRDFLCVLLSLHTLQRGSKPSKGRSYL